MEKMWIQAIPLSYLITSAGYTHRALAKKLGIRARTLDSWISGKSAPNTEERKQLAKLLRCEVGMINAAVFENQRRWNEYQIYLNENRRKNFSAKQIIVEAIVQIVVSVIPAAIATLVVLGKIQPHR